MVWLGWQDALKYCEWLTARLREWEGTPEPLATLIRREGWCVTLPSEPEWEKAARGTDGRAYPWGNVPDNNCGNFGGTGIMTTSAVGCFPAGVSPYGIEDMSGNVWEWTRSVWGAYPYPTDEAGLAEREYLEVREGVRRVRRGGAFFSSPRSARCTVRLGSGPYPHGGGMGCRAVLRLTTSLTRVALTSLRSPATITPGPSAMPGDGHWLPQCDPAIPCAPSLESTP